MGARSMSWCRTGRSGCSSRESWCSISPPTGSRALRACCPRTPKATSTAATSPSGSTRARSSFACRTRRASTSFRAPPNTVKKGVPTRLALAFGPGGVKLYVDGNVAGSHAYQGGLQGNQEPLVIGARDWKSSPGAADNLEAFFAGTIGALALYGRSLDAPAIAALGPAGTALAQVAGPDTGVQSASVEFGVQQPVQIVVTEETTITISPESLDTTPLRITPIPEAPVTVASAPKIFNPTVMSIEQSIRRQMGSADENEVRAAIYVRFMEIITTPISPDKQAVLDWLGLQVKQTRVEAARLALAEYDRWNRDPWSYQPPAGYDFPAYVIPDARSFIWFASTPNPPVLANKSWQSYLADIISNNGWSPLNNPIFNKGQTSSSIENVIGFPTFGTVLAYQKLYGTEDGAGVLAETTALLSSESFNPPPIEAAVNIGAIRSYYLKNIAPFTHRNLEIFTKQLTKRIKGVGPIPIDPDNQKVSMVDIARSLTKGQLRSAIAKIVSGDVLGNFVVSFVLSSALQEIISEFDSCSIRKPSCAAN